MIHAAIQVFRFELARSLTPGRCVIWLALCLFPSLLIGTLRYQGGGNIPDQGMIIVSYVLVPQISCMLGLLLWATPVVGAELEAQAWIYIAMRRHGRAAIALGKYAVAVVWTVTYGLISALGVSALSGIEASFSLLATLVVTVILSSVSYAALYLLIGAAVYRRATVVAVVFSLVLEGMVSWVPATINQFTVSYRLRSIVTKWMDIIPSGATVYFGEEPIWYNAGALIIYTILLLGVGLYLVQTREYPVQTEA